MDNSPHKLSRYDVTGVSSRLQNAIKYCTEVRKLSDAEFCIAPPIGGFLVLNCVLRIDQNLAKGTVSNTPAQIVYIVHSATLER